MIPLAAVFADSDGGQNVWVVDETTQEVGRRGVKVDEMAGDRVRVVEGLGSGEVIAVSAVQSLREGMRVEQMPDLKEL